MSLFTELTLTEQASLAGGTNKTVKVAKGGKGGSAFGSGGTNVAVLSGNGVGVNGDGTGGPSSADGIATGGDGGAAIIK